MCMAFLCNKNSKLTGDLILGPSQVIGTLLIRPATVSMKRPSCLPTRSRPSPLTFLSGHCPCQRSTAPTYRNTSGSPSSRFLASGCSSSSPLAFVSTTWTSSSPRRTTLHGKGPISGRGLPSKQTWASSAAACRGLNRWSSRGGRSAPAAVALAVIAAAVAPGIVLSRQEWC